MTLYRTCKFDVLARNKQLRLLWKLRPESMAVYRAMHSKQGTELDKLALADMAEEEGLNTLAVILRKWLTTKKPRKRRKQGRSKR